ncbi:hypothetical protein FALBO_612 [Fusarium albosuccineum]|uniref:Uncharacterized protein n=1 Tax=Fusarium albosuccineum TaxID=1237068 RepID=A0A8H4PMA6_9HYPO|nr:hypothetical protein FALBO_612 [Fusarium albosuccineum]
MEPMPVTYTEFCPPGKPTLRFTEGDTFKDPSNIEERRAHIKQYLRYMERYSDQLWDNWRALAVDMVDQAIWQVFFLDMKMANDLFPEWPWLEWKPSPADFSEGVSHVYADWLRRNRTV